MFALPRAKLVRPQALPNLCSNNYSNHLYLKSPPQSKKGSSSLSVSYSVSPAMESVASCFLAVMDRLGWRQCRYPSRKLRPMTSKSSHPYRNAHVNGSWERLINKYTNNILWWYQMWTACSIHTFMLRVTVGQLVGLQPHSAGDQSLILTTGVVHVLLAHSPCQG